MYNIKSHVSFQFRYKGMNVFFHDQINKRQTGTGKCKNILFTSIKIITNN